MDQNKSKIIISEKSSRTSSEFDIDVKTEVTDYSPNPAQNNETEFWKMYLFLYRLSYMYRKYSIYQ